MGFPEIEGHLHTCVEPGSRGWLRVVLATNVALALKEQRVGSHASLGTG